MIQDAPKSLRLMIARCADITSPGDSTMRVYIY